MSEDKENNFDFTGMVTIDPEFQIQPSGYMKGILTVRWVNRYKKGEDWQEKDVDVPFVLFGKPAEKAEALNLKAGMLVRVSFSLDTFKGYPQLRPWRVDLRTNQKPGKGPEKAQEEERPPHSDPESIGTTVDDEKLPF